MSSKLSKVVFGTLASLAMYGSIALAEGPSTKNLILFVVDGLSVENLANAHPNLKSLMDKGNVALLKSEVTDPAAAITSIAVGRTTTAGRISIAPDNTLTGYDSIVTRVIPEKGTKAAGLITTGNITDASSAAFYGHSKDASAVDFIASQAAVSGYDVVLGGGVEAFKTKAQGGLRDNNDDIWTGISEAYKVVKDVKELSAVTDPKSKVFGAFRKAEAPTLADMTVKAIDLLADTPSGFALVVNDSMVDQVKNATVDASSWDALDAAVGAALKFAAATPDTLVLVTGTVGVTDSIKKGFLSSKVVYDYSSIPVPVIAGGSSSAASWFKGYIPNTDVFVLMADAVGASKN